MREIAIPQKIIDMLVIRMGKEIETSLFYKDAAAFFDGFNLNGLAAYFMRESAGEETHARMIQRYLADKQAKYEQPSINYTPHGFNDFAALMTAYVEAEQQTTTDLYEIADAALKAGDWATVSWLTAPEPGAQFALIPYQKEELKGANDLKMEVLRVLGPNAQEMGIGMNAIDARMQRGE